MLMDAIRADPQWHNGEYQQQPTRILRIAAGTLFIAGNGALEFQRAAPTTAASDRYFQEHVEAMAASLDANDLLYALNASRDYDPSSKLDSITAPVTLVNFADDFINPPELGIAEAAIKRVKLGRFVLVPVSAETHGHHTHTWARFFDEYLRELLAEAEPRSSGFYTQEQAIRGAKVFNFICSGCHIVDGSGAPPRNLEGKDFLAQWNTVNDLFGKVSLTMPASHVLGLRKEEYAAVVAYLLQVNGLPAGAVPLADDREVLRRQFLTVGASPIRANTDSDGATGKEGYYSASQALRGRAFFQGSCSLCHTVDAAARTGESFDMPLASQVSVTKAPDGLQAGALRLKFNLAGPQFQDRWRTVGDLYSKVSTAMPAYDADGLNPETYAAIVAYLLQGNGLPAGSEALGTDVAVLNNMPILEAGFTKLFNGRDLSGFQLVLGHNCATGPGGCAATGPGTTFEVRSGAIYCSGKPLGYLYTTKKYLNFTLRLGYRFVSSRSFTPGAEFYGNSGWLLFIDENKVWPRMLEIQGAERTLLEPIAVDGHARFTVDAGARQRVLEPLQWNSVEIVSKSGQVRSYLNGTLISEVTQHDFIRAGHIGFQSEGAEIYFRNIRIREE
jgi:mono/diheme cytochrome c family protein